MRYKRHIFSLDDVMLNQMFRSKRLGNIDEDALRYISSMEWDAWLFKSDIEVDKAHVVMLY